MPSRRRRQEKVKPPKTIKSQKKLFRLKQTDLNPAPRQKLKSKAPKTQTFTTMTQMRFSRPPKLNRMFNQIVAKTQTCSRTQTKNRSQYRTTASFA